MKMLTIAITITAMAACLESAVLDPALYLGPSPPLLETSDSIPPEELWLQPLEARTERVAREAVESTTQTRKHQAVETGRMFWPRYSTPQTSLGINIPLTFSLSGSYGKQAMAPTGVIGNTYTSITGLSSLGGSLIPSATNLRSSIGSLTSSVSNLGSSIPSIGGPTSVIGNSYTGGVTGLSSLGVVPSPNNLRSSLGSLTSSVSNLGFSSPSIGFSLGSNQSGSGSFYGGYGKSALAGTGYGSYGLGARVRVYGGENTASWSGWGNGKWGHYGKG